MGYGDMTDVLMTVAKYPTLRAMARRLRTLASDIEPATLPVQLTEIADDLDWFEDAYQLRELLLVLPRVPGRK